MRDLKAAVDKGDTAAISEHKEAIELVSCQSDSEAIRMTATRALDFIMARPAPPPEPAPILSFVSGAAALLEAIARHRNEPEAPLPLVAAAGD